MQAAIEASDIGTNYEVLFHPPGVTLADHVLNCLDRLAQSDAELGIRLEDDVDVNEHIVHNVTTWPMIDDARFGAGWLFDPGGSAWESADRAAQRPSTQGRWHTGGYAYAQGIVFRRSDLFWIQAGCARWFEARSIAHHQYLDTAISHAIIDGGRQIAVHAPALIEHRVDLVSSLGHRHAQMRTSTTRGAFFKDWRRE